jgi:hypothetical protein
MNLVGLRDLSPGHYAGMQDYYRNVGLWLATPAQRASMLFAATWACSLDRSPVHSIPSSVSGGSASVSST